MAELKMRQFKLPYFLAIQFLALASYETPSQKEERLARQYCGSCHLFPEADLLYKVTWSKNILPQMAFRMGLATMKSLLQIHLLI